MRKQRSRSSVFRDHGPQSLPKEQAEKYCRSLGTPARALKDGQECPSYNYFLLVPKQTHSRLLSRSARWIGLKVVSLATVFVALMGWGQSATAQQARPAEQADNAQEPVPAQEPVQYRYWETNWSFDNIDLKDLAKKLSYIGIESPVDLSGRADVAFDVSVPLNAPRTPEAYKIDGTIRGRELVVDDVRLKTFSASVSLLDGTLSLRDLDALQSPSGNISGSARFDVAPQDTFDAELKLEGINGKPFVDLIAKLSNFALPELQAKSVDANVKAKGQVADLQEPQKWEASGDFRVLGLRVDGSKAFNVQTESFMMKDNQLSVRRLGARSPELPSFFLIADGDASLNDQREFEFKLAANDLPATELLGWVANDPSSILDGKMDIQATGTGSFNQKEDLPKINLTADVASPELKLFGVDLGTVEHRCQIQDQQIRVAPISDSQLESERSAIGKLSARYDATEQTYRLRDLNAQLFGGTLQGDVSLVRSGDGRHSLVANWKEISPQLSVPLPIGKQSTRVSMTTCGSIDWSVDPNRVDVPAGHKGTAKIELDDVRLNAEKVGDLDAKLTIDNDSADLAADGKLFDGEVSVKTIAPINVSSQWRDLTNRFAGQVLLDAVSVRSISKIMQAGPSRLDGDIGGKIDFVQTPNNPFRGHARLTLQRFSADSVTLSNRLSLDAISTGPDLVIASLSGRYAGGQLSASGRWSIEDGERIIVGRLVHSDGDRILLPISADADQWVGGDVTARATLTSRENRGLGLSRIRITGTIDAHNASTFGIPVGDAHSPMVVHVQTSPLNWSAKFPAVQSSIASGRVKGDLGFSSSIVGFNMDSHWRINHVDFQKILRDQLGSTTSIGQGNVTGELRLGGKQIRGERDLAGMFRLKLGGTDATAVPGVSSAGTLLGASSLSGVRFSEGVAEGRIRRGDIVIEKATMSSSRAALQAEGRIAMDKGRMDIRAILSTGNFQGQTELLSGLGAPGVRDVLPIGQVNQLLSDRTIVFEMVGPPRDPVVRLLPAETVRANARRFLQQELVGVIALDSVFD